MLVGDVDDGGASGGFLGKMTGGLGRGRGLAGEVTRVLVEEVIFTSGLSRES